MPEFIWLDGRLARAAGAHLSVTDRGFQLGDGVFETLRARRGVAIELREHLDRLRESAAATEIPLPDDDRIVRGIYDLLGAEGLDGPGSDDGAAPGDAAMRITASRGPVEGRGMAISPEASGTISIQAWPFAPPAADLLERGVRVTVAIAAARSVVAAGRGEIDVPGRVGARQARGKPARRGRRADADPRRRAERGDVREPVPRPRPRTPDPAPERRDPRRHDAHLAPRARPDARPHAARAHDAS